MLWAPCRALRISCGMPANPGLAEVTMFCWAIHQFIYLGQLLPVAGRLRRRVARGVPPSQHANKPENRT